MDQELSQHNPESLNDAQEAARLRIFHQHRSLLFSIAYRMLGSWADAEDMVQEAFIRWRQAAEGDIQSPRAFLVTIVSRLSINHLQSARVQREEYFGEWLPEPVLTGANGQPDLARIDESLSMAFLILLERLNPIERAVFLLRETFEYEYEEIARILGINEANCRQILHRARRHVAEVRPRFDASLQERERLLEAFIRASTSGDLDGLVALLANNVVLHSDGGGKAPALPKPVLGSNDVARALLGGQKKFVPKNLVRRIAEVNGHPGVVAYVEGKPFAVITLDVAGGLIQAIYIVSNPEKLARLGALPGAPC